jgi:hypothetical protein
MSLPAFTHDPSAILPYKVDWSKWLDGDRIKTVVWTLEAPLIKISEMKTTTDCIVMVKCPDNIEADNFTISCKITTTKGLTDERSFTLKVRDR